MPTLGKMMTMVFGSRNERLLKRYRAMVDRINDQEEAIRKRTDIELRDRTLEIRRELQSGKVKGVDILPEAFAIIRESMDRHVGIRAIFNPEETFDPDQLDDAMLNLYDHVQQSLIKTGMSWRRVPLPLELYEAVRKLYPDSRPPFRARCFDVQMIGGIVLYEGKIAEMATGEGKTFVAPLACFLRSLEGYHCHVVTVNDYLVRRDSQWVAPAFENVGLSVGYIQAEMEPGGEARRQAYECDVTYGTSSEFGFDFLRDNMKEKRSLQVQGPLDFAIVDEVDSILIDEARTPLIISGNAHDDAPKYKAADEVARKIVELNKPFTALEKQEETAKRTIKGSEGDEDHATTKAEREAARQRGAEAEKVLEEIEQKKKSVTQYYEVELDRKSVHLTHEGFAAAQAEAGVGSFFVGANMEWVHLMEQAMRAHVVYEKDKDYVVERGSSGQLEVVIVDEYTGRKMTGRQWSDGLHQAVEAKERVPIKTETQTMATITLQNFFKMYKALAGMTGTAETEAEEFNKIYRLDVVTIPTNRKMVRVDNHDRIYRTEREKWDAIIEEIKETSDAGRPVLVGTTSVEKSEMLSERLMRKYGIKHNVLNAKFHEREAEIIADAGKQHVNAHGETVGNVTIATNMAGRGTDIKLIPGTLTAGGLHVVGTERHTARRIDNQLRGRSGRQGDPGSSRFYVSLQDDLIKMFAGDWTIKAFKRLGLQEGEAVEDKFINKIILSAQKKVEERNFLARKNLLEYDEVMEYQRRTFYGLRQRVLIGHEIESVIWNMISEAIVDAVRKYITEDFAAATISEWVRVNLDTQIDARDLHGIHGLNNIEAYIKAQARAEAETNITSTLGEFTGEDASDVKGWDVKGMQSWAMSRFKVNLSMSQIRQSTAREIEARLRDAAVEQVNRTDCTPVMKYLDPHYAERELCAWAQDKFRLTITPEELSHPGADRSQLPAAEIVNLIETRARQEYARRELTYPVEHALAFAFGGSQDVTTDNPYGAEYVKAWAAHKYEIDLSIEHIRGTPMHRLREELIGYQEQFLRGGKAEEMADKLSSQNPDADSLRQALNKRLDLKLTVRDMEVGPNEENPSAPASLKELARQRVRAFIRRELTDLEQFVLIQIFDQTWKDHLYAMDILKTGIGLHAFAERDPRVLYKKEGFAYFRQMMESVRDKVTDLVFRARVVGQVEARSAYRETAAVHDTSTGYGVGETVAATAEAKPAGEMQAAANRTQGEASKPKPIVRTGPKVGRNDPCPCGSGKKYKKCHGADAV